MYIGCVHDDLMVEVQDRVVVQGRGGHYKLVALPFCTIFSFHKGSGFLATVTRFSARRSASRASASAACNSLNPLGGFCNAR